MTFWQAGAVFLLLLVLVAQVLVLALARCRRRGDAEQEVTKLLVVTRNREQNIEDLLARLYRCSDNEPFEVTVMDRSEDDTPLIVERLARHYPGLKLVAGSKDIEKN